MDYRFWRHGFTSKYVREMSVDWLRQEFVFASFTFWGRSISKTLSTHLTCFFSISRKNISNECLHWLDAMSEVYNTVRVFDGRVMWAWPENFKPLSYLPLWLVRRHFGQLLEQSDRAPRRSDALLTLSEKVWNEHTTWWRQNLITYMKEHTNNP